MVKSHQETLFDKPVARGARFVVVFGALLAAAWGGFIVLLADSGAAPEPSAAAASVEVVRAPAPGDVGNVEFGPPVADLPSLALPPTPVDYNDFGPPVADLPSLAAPRGAEAGAEVDSLPVDSMQNG